MLRNARVHGRLLYTMCSLKYMCANIRRTNGLVFSTTRALRLVAFRGRSRHTSGFEPFETFELPQQELLTSATTAEVGHSEIDQQHMYFHPTAGSDVFQWVESPLGDAELARAASRCACCFYFASCGQGSNMQLRRKQYSYAKCTAVVHSYSRLQLNWRK